MLRKSMSGRRRRLRPQVVVRQARPHRGPRRPSRLRLSHSTGSHLADESRRAPRARSRASSSVSVPHPALALGLGHLPAEPRRRGALPRRVGEHVHVRKPRRARAKCNRLLELLLGLAGKADDQVRRDRQAGDPCACRPRPAPRSPRPGCVAPCASAPRRCPTGRAGAGAASAGRRLRPQVEKAGLQVERLQRRQAAAAGWSCPAAARSTSSRKSAPRSDP